MAKIIKNPVAKSGLQLLETDHLKLSNSGIVSHTQIDAFINTTVPNTYIPYTGATADVDLGAFDITTTGLITGGQLTIDNLNINGNSIVSTAGDIRIDPAAGNDVVLDAHWEFDGGVMTAISDVNTTITAYVGKNITIESVTFDGGVMAGIASLTSTGTITAPTVKAATGVQLNLSGGDNAAGGGGDLSLQGGDATAGVNDGGNVYLIPGMGFGGGANGGIYLYNPAEDCNVQLAYTLTGDQVITIPDATGTLALTSVATLANLASIGTITTGTWNGTDIAVADGGTGLGAIADGSVLATNAANVLSAITWHAAGTKILTNIDGTISWEAAGAGAATAWDDVGDPDADVSISVAGFETLITSTLNEAAHTVWTIYDSTADLTAAVTLLKLTFNDNGDADGTFLNCLDNNSGDSKFSIGVDGNTLIAGTLGVTGAITGNVTGNCSGTALTVTQAAQAAITSLGTLTTLTVDNITINGNAISSDLAAALTITPLAGQNITLDGAVTIDAGVVAGITSLTADNIVVNTGVLPDANDGAYLGAAGTAFSDLFLAEGGVINWDSGDAIITQTGNDISISGITSFGLGTATAVTLGTIELGAAADTTISRSGAGAIQVEGVQVILSGAALGTPASGTLTNCTGLPAAAVVAGSLVAAMEASDHGAAATDQIINVCYGTGAAPAANTTTEGAIYITYTP